MARLYDYTAQELEFTFKEYLDHNKTLTFYKPEMLKGGENAGQIVDVPIYSPLSIMAFCLFAEISVKTFNNYCNEDLQKGSELFHSAIRVRTYIQDEQLRGGLSGIYNANLAKVMNGLKEQQEIELHATKEVINITIQGTEADLT